jgi:hypothetical protein
MPWGLRTTLAFLLLRLIGIAPAPSAAQESLTVHPAGVVTWDEIVGRDAAQPQSPAAPVTYAVPFMRTRPGEEIATAAASGRHSPTGRAAVTPPPTPPQPSGPAIATNFAALGDNDTAIPPDTMGAVGPSHLMTMLNSQVRIQDKGGGTISTVSLSSFWTGGTGLSGSPFDPHIIYDSLSGRWLATVFANGNSSTSQVWFAISATNNPTGTWTFFGFTADPGGTTWADYPGCGVNATWVAITANMFTVSGTPAFSGAKMWVIDKSTALTGGPLTTTVFPTSFDAAGGADGFALKPAVTYSAAEPTLYLIDSSGFSAGGTQLLRLSRITGTGPAPAWSVQPGSSFAGTGLFFVTHNFDTTQIGAAQAGTATTVDTGDSRASDSAFRNGRLWFAHSGGLPVGAVDRTAVSWYQLDPTAMPTPIVQSGVFDGGAGVHHFFPSIAANAANDALIGFSRSDATRFVEAVTASRFGSDALGTMTAPGVLKSGEASYVKDFGSGMVRWGDYSATSVDPGDDLTFWTIQEYAAVDVGPNPNDDRWATWWGSTGVSTSTTSTTSTTTTTTITTTTATTTTVPITTTTAAPTTTTTSSTTTQAPTTTATTAITTTTTTTALPTTSTQAQTTSTTTSTTTTSATTLTNLSTTTTTASISTSTWSTTTSVLATRPTSTTLFECGLTPANGCQPAAMRRAQLLLRKRKLAWKWRSRAAVSTSDFGSPPTVTGYFLCVYDASGEKMRARAPAGQRCRTKPCWKAIGAMGFMYGGAGTPDGLTKLLLKAGAAGRGKLGVTGGGVNLHLPTLPLTPPVRVQLQQSSSTTCWEANYTHASRNDATEFKAKSN